MIQALKNFYIQLGTALGISPDNILQADVPIRYKEGKEKCMYCRDLSILGVRIRMLLVLPL